jgi:hypothetical protein
MNDIMRLDQVSKKLEQQSLPIKTSYKLAKLSLAIEKEAAFYKNKYLEFLSTYAETLEDGSFNMDENGDIKIKDGMEQECHTRLFELETLEIDFPNIEFSIEEFEGAELMVSDMKILANFIKD